MSFHRKVPVIPQERKALIASLIKELPEPQQQVLSLHYEEHLYLNEIAQVMRITPNEAARLYVQAHKALRPHLGWRLK